MIGRLVVLEDGAAHSDRGGGGFVLQLTVIRHDREAQSGEHRASEMNLQGTTTSHCCSVGNAPVTHDNEQVNK